MSLLHLNQLSVGRHQTPLSEPFHFSLEAGDILAILGPNGCGKTTLLHTLARCLAPLAGEVQLHGKTIANYSRKHLAKHIGVLLQDFHVAQPQTVRDYCDASRYPHRAYFKKQASEHDAIIDEALCLMQLDTMQHKNILELSGGEKRRLALASVIAQTPSIYLLDEPTNHLDVHFQKSAMQYFKDQAMHHGKAVVFSCHDLTLANAYSTHTLIMHADGTHVVRRTGEILTERNMTRLFMTS